MLQAGRITQALRQQPLRDTIWQSARQHAYQKLSPARQVRGIRQQSSLNSRTSRMRAQVQAWSTWQSSILRRIRNVRYNSSQGPKPNVTPNLGSPKSLSFSERFRKLSREYGWSAMGVYLLLSALDFPFCFLAVRLLGTDRIGQAEKAVIDMFWRLVEVPFPNARMGREQAKEVIDEAVSDPATREGKGWGVEAAQERNRGEEANLTTQLLLAYAIHKSFIFIRVPLTAAVTPKVVKTLRGWGWNIGKRRPKTP